MGNTDPVRCQSPIFLRGNHNDLYGGSPVAHCQINMSMVRSHCDRAHDYARDNYSELQMSSICGCFHCLETFGPREIQDWIFNNEKTAVCPKCGSDSVIGNFSKFPVTHDFLKAMNERWHGVHEQTRNLKK